MDKEKDIIHKIQNKAIYVILIIIIIIIIILQYYYIIITIFIITLTQIICTFKK
jgi:uncharacterized membrane protein